MTTDQTSNSKIRLADGLLYDGAYALGNDRTLGYKRNGNRIWLVELDRSGQVVHEAKIPDRWRPAIEFFFVREEEPMENEDDDNS